MNTDCPRHDIDYYSGCPDCQAGLERRAREETAHVPHEPKTNNPTPSPFSIDATNQPSPTIEVVREKQRLVEQRWKKMGEKEMDLDIRTSVEPLVVRSPDGIVTNIGEAQERITLADVIEWARFHCVSFESVTFGTRFEYHDLGPLTLPVARIGSEGSDVPRRCPCLEGDDR